MAEMALAAGLSGAKMANEHLDKVKDPVQYKWKKMRGEIPRDDPDIRDHRNHEEKGLVLRKRSEMLSDEEVVEVVRHRGEVLPRRPRRPGMGRRPSSMDNMRDGYQGSSRGRSSAGGTSSDRYYDSEGSVPPQGRTRPKSESGRSRRRKGSSSRSSSSTSSSSLGSSTDDEKKCRKVARKKWITATLASVATIHAASKVYSSIEAHDDRIIQVERGEISPAEAQKQKRAARWQDAAAIGLAALGIKGAMSEWKEVSAENKEHQELLRKKEEHHKKRLEMERRKKAKEQSGYYKGRDGNWYYDGPLPQHSERSKSRSSRGAIDGPRNGERKLLRGPDDYYDDDLRSRTAVWGSDREPARDRSRSAYSRRDRSSYGRDRDQGRDDSPEKRDRSRRRSSRYYDSEDDDYRR